MARSGGSLGAYAVSRLALTLPMVLILLTMVFVLMRVAPGDPVQSAVGGRIPQNQIDQIRADAGIDDPLVVQYFTYLGDVATLDFGETITDNRQVTDVIVESGGATLTLTLAALLVAVGLGLPLGLLAGRYRDTAVDTSLRIFGILTYAAPVFFVGLLAQLLFGSILGWLPTSGEADPVTFVDEVTHILLIDALIAGDLEAFRDALLHLILPAATLGLLVAGVFLRLTRVNVMQALRGDYIEAARARGIGERSVVVRHAFRNALVPVITVMGLQVALLLSGAVLTELTFDWPGLGSELIAYLNERDYIAVQGIITVFALVVVVVSIVIDLVTAMVDPRVRY
jgi:peptide/nickel transport system permease protein